MKLLERRDSIKRGCSLIGNYCFFEIFEPYPSTRFFFTIFLPLDDYSQISASRFFCLASPGIMEQVVDSSSMRSTMQLQFLGCATLRQSREYSLKIEFIPRGDNLNSQLGSNFSHSSQAPYHSPPVSAPINSLIASASQSCPTQFLTKQAQRCRKKLRSTVFL